MGADDPRAAGRGVRVRRATATGGDRGARLLVKRTVDTVLSLVLLLLGLPLFVAIVIAVRFSSPGPVLFRQLRHGRHGRPFVMLKFRTMCDEADRLLADLAPLNEADPPLFKLAADPRVTGVGRRLRHHGLDELPQLVNVLRGEMSLVGPRPLPCDEAEALERLVPSRTLMRPGITGVWQVSGGPALSTAELCLLDDLYVATWSLLGDASILGRTIVRVLSGAAPPRCTVQP